MKIGIDMDDTMADTFLFNSKINIKEKTDLLRVNNLKDMYKACKLL